MINNIDNQGKQLPYTVPQGFFESSATAIQAAVNRERSKRRRASIVKWSLSAAAAAAIAVTLLVTLKPGNNTLPSSTLVAQQTSDQVIAGMSDEDLDMCVVINNCDEYLASYDYDEYYY